MNLLVFLVLLVTAVSAQDECCLPPFSLFSIPSDIIHIFPLVSADLYLIRGGVVDPLIQVPGISRTLNVGPLINDFPVILVANNPYLVVNFVFIPLEVDNVLRVSLLPFANGIIPTMPQRFRVVLDCTGVNSATQLVTIQVNISSYDNTTGEEYCPLYFLFGKDCGSFPSGPSPEEIMDYMETDFVSNITFPDYIGCNKTIEPPSRPIDIDNNILVPILSTLIPLTVLIVIVIVIGLILWATRYKILKRQRQQLLHLEIVGDAYKNKRDAWIPARTPHEKEFPPDKLVLKRALGEGAFGTVYEGEATGIVEDGVVTLVAVKQLLNPNAADEFFREVSFMSRLQHDKVVSLLGVCGLEEPYAMIFEYMDLGDLCSFLRDAAQLRDESLGADVLTPDQLVYIALQIAEGMAYIASTKLVHRDLAARNCLVATGLVIKIADFGLSRNLYSTDYYRVQGSTLLPIRWMPPESIQYGKFSEASDVYSYGVLLWEIFTYGEQPFAGYTNEEVMEKKIKKEHLKIPAGCPLSDVINDCWVWKPKERPNFKELCSHLKTLLYDMKQNEK